MEVVYTEYEYYCVLFIPSNVWANRSTSALTTAKRCRLIKI